MRRALAALLLVAIACAHRPADKFPPPHGLELAFILPSGTSFLGGLTGHLRIEPGETMTHALVNELRASPITFFFDTKKPALFVDQPGIGERKMFPLRPPYPQKHRLPVVGGEAELEIRAVDR